MTALQDAEQIVNFKELLHPAFRCQSSYRSYDWEEVATSRTGFRVVIEAIQERCCLSRSPMANAGP